jgi:5-methyltetrahydrofolate--homocysteine methyltransferase
MSLTEKLSESLQAGDTKAVEERTRAAIAAGLLPGTILNEGLIAGMTIVGEKFKSREIFLPDVLLSARAMAAAMELLKPLLIRDGVETAGKVVLGTVRGDLHDIGKNLVAILLRGAGLEVIDLGNDVSPQRFVETARREGAGVIGLSALLTTTMPVMREVVDLARREGIRDRTRILVGGAPLNAGYAREIGADAYAFDGVSAVEWVKRLLAEG